MDLYTKTTAAKILANMPATRTEISDPANPNRVIGYVWEDTSGDSVHTWRLYTPFHPATVSVRDSVWEATRYVVGVFDTFKGHKATTHLDNPALLV